MPGASLGLAYQNKAAIYDILFKASAKATLTYRGRSQTARRQARHDLGAPRMGLGHDPSPASPYDCAWRRVAAYERALEHGLTPYRALAAVLSWIAQETTSLRDRAAG